MKQVQKKIKVIMHYFPNGCYDKREKAYFFIKCNKNKKEIYIDKNGNKTDMTINELINEIKEALDKEILQ